MDSIAEQLVNRLRRDPNDTQAYEALKAHYQSSGDFASLTNLIEGWAGFQTSTAMASEAYLEAARVARHGGGDDERVRALYQRAVDADPENQEATLELIGFLEAGGDPNALAEFLDGHLRTIETLEVPPAFVADLYTRLGDLWKTAFERPDVARPCYERALAFDPTHTGAAYAARKLAQESGDLTSTAELYAAEAEAETDPERKIQLFARLAELFARELDDVDGAIGALRSALAVAPGDVQVMHQLASYLSQRAARTDGESAQRDQRRAGELYYQIAQGVEPEEALTYLEAALGAAPQHEGALAMLEQVAAQLGRSDMLAGYWVAYVASAGAGPEVDQRRMYLAQAYDRAGQIEDAIFCLEQAHSDAQVAQYLNELRARRPARPSSPPMAHEPPPSAAAAAVSIEPNAGDDAPAPRPATLDERPTARPGRRRRLSSERPLDVSPRLTTLRRAVHELSAQRKHDEAAAACREILELDPNDPEAFSLLESYYRKNRDHASLRDLLLASTRSGGLSVDARKLRLREVAGLCEGKLKDSEGAIEAWQSVVALDPADSDAVKSLKRLLQKAQRWDDLAAVLEREALATTSTKEKVELISQIAAIHRDKRKDLVEAAEALRQLVALEPNAATRDELCEMLLTIESYADAIPLLRERVREADDEREKLRLLRVLAVALEDKLHDADGAFETNQAILALRPKDGEALERMQRIDEASGNTERLLSTLERRAMVAVRAERPPIFVRMGEIAEQTLGDIDKAAEYYGNALDLDPGHEAALGALTRMFEQRGRYPDLVELLRERVLVEKDPAQRVELYRRIARICFEHLGQRDEAAEAFRGVLAAKEDEEALRFMVSFERDRGGSKELATLLPRLAAIVEASERRALKLELAQLLDRELHRPNEALLELREVIDGPIEASLEPALALFAELCERQGDAPGLALALHRQLDGAIEKSERVALAQKLADLYEDKLRDDEHAEKAIAVLQTWAHEDERNVVARRRLRARLLGRKRDAELLETLDALASWEDDFEAREAATLEAARVAFEGLHDVDGAWRRLAPLVEECHEDALALLSEIARKSGRSPQLAALCVAAAQEAADPEVQARHWSAAARVFADDVQDPAQALEAALRMLATDLGNREFLAQVDDYAARVGAWPRLNQVYDKLLKQSADDAARVELLLRHATLLDERARDASEALDRVLRACGLAPSDDRLLARAEELARRCGRTEELLVVYDRKRSKTAEDAGKVELLLRAARLCDTALEDRDRANTYMKSALAIAKTDATLAGEIVKAAVELDHQRPDRGSDAALRFLVRAHRELAEKADPEIGTALILQGHTLLKDRLDDERGAFDLLRQGLSYFPLRDDLYAVLLERATEWKRLDALDAHLSRAVDDALDPKSAAVLLARRARLLEGPLGRPQDAADAFARLSQLRPDDLEAAEKVRASLRKAKRYQDLLLALHKQLQRVKNADEKLALLKEAALTWENDLKNRWEALDAWRKVLDFAPDDADAKSAVVRLDRRSVAPPAPRTNDELFGDDAAEDPVIPRDAALPNLSAAPSVEAEPEPEARAAEANDDEHDDAPTVPPAVAAAAAEPAGAEAESAAADAAPESAPAGAADLLANDLAAAAGSEPASTHGDPGEDDDDALTAPPKAREDAPVASDFALPASDDLAHLDALLDAPAPASAPPPSAAPAVSPAVSSDEIEVEVDTGMHAQPAADSAPAPRLTKPPTLPPRRSRSYAPPPPAEAEAAPVEATMPRPTPSAAPPPLPSLRNTKAGVSVPPPVPPAPRTRKTSAPPPPPPSATRTGRHPSMPPPLPSQRTGSLPPVTSRPPSAAPPPLPSSSSSGASSAPRSGPPPLPRKG